MADTQSMQIDTKFSVPTVAARSHEFKHKHILTICACCSVNSLSLQSCRNVERRELGFSLVQGFMKSSGKSDEHWMFVAKGATYLSPTSRSGSGPGTGLIPPKHKKLDLIRAKLFKGSTFLLLCNVFLLLCGFGTFIKSSLLWVHVQFGVMSRCFVSLQTDQHQFHISFRSSFTSNR